MKQLNWPPLVAGITILLLLSFLFFQTQRVDNINQEHSEVLQLLQRSQQLDGNLRQDLIRVYYDQHHNFDPLLDRMTELEVILERLRYSPYRAFRMANSGVEYYLTRLINLHHERKELLSGYMTHMVLLKNAAVGLSQKSLIAALAEQAPEHLTAISDYRNTLLAYVSTPSEQLTEQADDMLIEMEDLLLELEEDAELSASLMVQLTFDFQHGKIAFDSRVLVERMLDQLFQLPTQSIMSQLTQVYLDYHQQQERISSYYRIGLFATGALLLVFLVVTLLRLRNTASHLMEEKDLAEITLGSIGDGVISTDTHGRIGYMNRAAEALTGVDTESAIGQPLEAVLPLYSEITSQPIDSPALRCIENEITIDIQNHVYLVRADGSRSNTALTASPIGHKGERPVGAVLVVQDVGDAQSMAEQLSYETNHDTLTGLLNRMTFAQKIQRYLDNSEESKYSPILWHIDLDHFSVINDICGAKGGDGFLRTTAGALKRVLGEHDILSRIGGDEFAILRPNADPADALDMACRLRELINGLEFEWEDNRFDTTATIGVVILSQNYLDISDVFMAAKSAVDTARDGGRNNIYVHTKDVYENSRKHALSLWVPRIKRALDEGRYRLYLQSISPITDKGCLKPHHAEVLLRMEDEEGRIIPPIFIPAAEEYNLMPQIDRWVIEQVCINVAAAHQQQLAHRHMCYSVNLSGTTLGDTFFLDFIRNLFAEHQTPTAQICFEITETAAIQNLEAAMQFIHATRDLGCKFALDDFGTGMSSFAYLQNLPVDYLKIDGAFVKQLAKDPVQYSIVQSVNTVGQALKMETIAEFVEDEDIIRGLSEIGVDYAQGYGIDQPRPWDQYFEQGQTEKLLS